MRDLLIVLLVLSMHACAPAVAGTPTPPTGRWLTASGNLEVVVAPCGEALCGKVARVVANHSMANPNQELGEQPQIGLTILDTFTPSGADAWEGHIFNRENGKTYRCRLRLLDPDQLEVRPYIGIHLIGQTQTWHRVAESASTP
jgi:uncharacterized protein (DUF2147 family)